MLCVTNLRKTQKMIKLLSVAALVCSTVLLAACGGGGGSAGNGQSAVYAANAGSAAIGVAMSNASISIQPLPAGSNAEVLVTADAGGKFTVPSGTKFPALVKATSINKQYTFYGYIKSADQTGIPVNPITTTLLTLAASGHPSTITTALDASTLNVAREKTATLFSALLNATGQSNTTDFLSKTFSTDHTGLDLVLDSVGIQLSNNGVISITNKMTGVVTVVDPQSIAAIPFDANAISQMNTLPIGLCANFLDGLTSQSLINDASIYDASFLDSGRNRTAFISEIAQVTGSDTFKISMPVFIGEDAYGNLVYSVNLTNSTTNDYINDYALTTKKDVSSAGCVLVGDQNPFEIVIQPAIKSLIRVDSLTDNVATKFAGLEIYIGAHSDWAFASNDYANTRIYSARVDVCDSASNCTLLATLTNPGGAAKGIFNLDGIYANNNFRMLEGTSFALTTDIINPIKITFFSSPTAPLTGTTNAIGSSIYTRATGGAFTAQEIAAIEMPSIANPAILTNPLTNPTVQWNSGSGVISELGVTSAYNGLITSDWRILLKSGTGSTTFNFSETQNSQYRAIGIASHIPNRSGMIETKYIWAPTCASCY